MYIYVEIYMEIFIFTFLINKYNILRQLFRLSTFITYNVTYY